MTDSPANSPPASAGFDKLDALKEELRAAFSSGGDALRDCLRRLDAEVRSRFKKDVSHQIIARVAAVSAGQRAPFPALLGALSVLGISVPPETIIRGLLLRERSESSDELLQDAFVWSLTPSAPDGQGSERESLPVSVFFLRILRRHFGEHFPALGLVIWDRAREQKNLPGWCESWATFSCALLRATPDLPRRVSQDLSNQYAERTAEAGASSAGTLTPFLLFLIRELAPLSPEVAARVRVAPVGLVLKVQTQEILDYPPPSAPEKAVPAPLPPSGHPPLAAQDASGSGEKGEVSEFAGLPQHVELAVKSMLSYLRSLFLTHTALTDGLAAAHKERDALGVQLGEQRDVVRKLTEDFERLSAELVAAQAQQEAEKGRALKLERANAALRDEQAEATARQEGLKQELQSSKEDYDRLLSRSDHDIGQLRQHVLDGVYTDLREFWHLMAKMLEKVLRGERETRHLASVWNQLDSVLADRLGKPGQPVKVGPPEQSEPQP